MNPSTPANRLQKPLSHPSLRAVLTRSGIVMLAVVALLLLVAGTVLAGFAQNKIDQCSNNNNVLGQCVWINSIVQANNSVYREGMSNPQRALWMGVTDGPTHTIEFDMQWSKGGIHGYDFLTSYEQAQATAQALGVFTLTLNECGDLGGDTATCSAVTGAGSYFIDIEVPDDPYISKDGATQLRLDAYEAMYGNRTIRLRADQPITMAVMSLAHDLPDGADTGDSFVHYTVVFTTSAQNVLLQAAGHVARSLGPTGWGTGLGAASISGGPWHFKNFKFDGTGGSQDNQITTALPTAVRLIGLSVSATANYGTLVPTALALGLGLVLMMVRVQSKRR